MLRTLTRCVAAACHRESQLLVLVSMQRTAGWSAWTPHSPCGHAPRTRVCHAGPRCPRGRDSRPRACYPHRRHCRQVLGVERDADTNAINRAYTQRKFHARGNEAATQRIEAAHSKLMMEALNARLKVQRRGRVCVPVCVAGGLLA